MKKTRKQKGMVFCILALTAMFLWGCAPQSSQMGNIGATVAKNAALADAGLAESQVETVTTELDERNGTAYYAVSFTANGQVYRYDIDALTGVVIQAEIGSNTVSSDQMQEPPNPSTGTTDGTITIAEAKAIALTHAGLTESQVTFVKSNLEYDDGRQLYDLEVYTEDYEEYDYEIDAMTGEIYSHDLDAEAYVPPVSGNEITAEEAKALALSQVPGATESDIVEFETDRDDGRISYDGKIHYDGMEYEFEIDGYSESIRSWDAEPIGR